MQNDWWTGLAERTQRYADMVDMGAFYEALKDVYGLSYEIQASLRFSDGSTLLTDKEVILQYLSEHFEGLFSDRRIVQESSLAKIPKVDVKLELDDPPFREDIRKATMQVKVGKLTGIDGIPAEVYQHGGEAVLDKLQDLFTNCWEKGSLPQDLRDAVTVSLYKNKGEKSDGSNYRGITLLSTAGKILARVLLNKLITTIAQENTPESQCGFRSNRGTVDMIFMLRQIQEKCREQNMGLYAAFVDLTKAFDTVCRDGLWKILARLGCPPKFLIIFRQLHEGQQSQVKRNGSLSGSSPISNGVDQGCVLAPTFISIFFSIMLHEAKEDLPDGIYIFFSEQTAVSSTFGVSSLAQKPSRNSSLSCCLLTTASFSPTEEALQLIVNRFSVAAKNFGLTINLNKTEVLYQPPPRVAYSPPHISIDGTNLNAAEHFTYLGSVISNDATVSKDLDNRLSKATSSFGRLSKRVWQSHLLRLSTKIQVSRYTGPLSFPPSCTVPRPGFSIVSISGYLSGFTNAACAPSLASNGKTTCRTKKSSREPACPA